MFLLKPSVISKCKYFNIHYSYICNILIMENTAFSIDGKSSEITTYDMYNMYSPIWMLDPRVRAIIEDATALADKYRTPPIFDVPLSISIIDDDGMQVQAEAERVRTDDAFDLSYPVLPKSEHEYADDSMALSFTEMTEVNVMPEELIPSDTFDDKLDSAMPKGLDTDVTTICSDVIESPLSAGSSAESTIYYIDCAEAEDDHDKTYELELRSIISTIMAHKNLKQIETALEKNKKNIDNDVAIDILISYNRYNIFSWCYNNLVRFNALTFYFGYKNYKYGILLAWIYGTTVKMSEHDFPLLGAIHSGNIASIKKCYAKFNNSIPLDDFHFINAVRGENEEIVAYLLPKMSHISDDVKNFVEKHGTVEIKLLFA
jgi:hypothetical protein